MPVFLNVILFLEKGEIKVGNEIQRSITFQKKVPYFKMIGDAHFTHFIQEKGKIENSKTMEGLKNVSRCRIKHEIRMPFDKRRFHLISFHS